MFGNKPRKPPVGIIGNTAMKSTDYFVMNPPPATGTHPDGGHRWWWGDLKNANKAAKSSLKPKNSKKAAPAPDNIEVGNRVEVLVDDEICEGSFRP